jgi:hypothetical protein
MQDPTTDLALPYIVIAFAIFWALVIGLISLLSGWQRLAQRYRATLPPTGRCWTWQYGMVGWAGYNGVLNLTANNQGLFMEVLWLFGFGHPRLFIPWQDFREAKIVNYFFRRQVKAQVGFPPLATIHLPAMVFEETAGRKVLDTPTP